jgi:hypothetical protein
MKRLSKKVKKRKIAITVKLLPDATEIDKYIDRLKNRRN